MKIFLSYARLDNQTPLKRVSKFRRAYRAEVAQTIGRECEVFMDQASIRWGAEWRKTIESRIRRSDCFVAIVTPSYFNSRMCIYELQCAFEAGIRVLPIYFRSCDSLSSNFKEDGSEPEINRKLNETSRRLADLHMQDFRELRNEKIKSVAVQKFLAKRAKEAARECDDGGPGNRSAPAKG